MTQRKLEAAALGAALLLGLAGDALLRAPAPGLNVFVWIAALGAGILFLGARAEPRASAESRWLVGVAVVFAAGVAWRAGPVLWLLDLFAAAALLGLAALRAGEPWVRRTGVFDYAVAGVAAGANAAIGAPFLLARIDWRSSTRLTPAWWRHGGAAVRGVLLALPVLLVFGGLFATADAVFSRMLQDTLRLDLGRIVGHLALISLLAWITAGHLRGSLFGGVPAEVRVAPPGRGALGIVETGVLLGLVDLLFLSFVLVQLRYLFGGADLVLVTPGLTYAEYARRGFFELVAAATLVLPLLLAVDFAAGRRDARQERVFRALAGVQVLAVLAIMGSALQRMRLYQSAYGLTDDRLYATAFMIWLAVVFLWFAATVLRGRRPRFAFGALVTGLAALAALNAANPDALIVRANTARVSAGKSFDVAYAASLSPDAVPPLLAARDRLTAAERCRLSALLLERWSERWREQPGDWRSWNRGRSRAQHLLQRNEQALRADCPPA